MRVVIGHRFDYDTPRRRGSEKSLKILLSASVPPCDVIGYQVNRLCKRARKSMRRRRSVPHLCAEQTDGPGFFLLLIVVGRVVTLVASTDVHDVDETEHPVVQRVSAVHADDEVPARLRKPILYLGPGGPGRRALVEHTTDQCAVGLLNDGRRPEQPVYRIVDSLNRGFAPVSMMRLPLPSAI
jgi:hypothetical protein